MTIQSSSPRTRAISFLGSIRRTAATLGKFPEPDSLVLGLGGQGTHAQPVADLAAYVDPFIGTGPAPTSNYGQEFDSGDVFPGATYPTGMLAWSPDTAEHSLPAREGHASATWIETTAKNAACQSRWATML